MKYRHVVGIATFAVWTLVAASVGGAWAVWKWYGERFDAEKTRAITQRIEAQKPFLQKKLDLYFEAARVAEVLTEWGIDPTSQEWKDATKRFWALRWGELEMVGDPGIRNAMRMIGQQINEVENNPRRLRHDLRWAVECLADQLRDSLETAWGQPSSGEKGTPILDDRSEPSGCYAGRGGPARLQGMKPFEARSNIDPDRDEIDYLDKKFQETTIRQ